MLFYAAAIASGTRGALRRIKKTNPERYAQLKQRWELNQAQSELYRNYARKHRKEVMTKALNAVKGFFKKL